MLQRQHQWGVFYLVLHLTFVMMAVVMVYSFEIPALSSSIWPYRSHVGARRPKAMLKRRDWRSGNTYRPTIPLPSSFAGQQRLWASPLTKEVPLNVQDVEDETEKGEAEEGNEGGDLQQRFEVRDTDATSGGWAEELLGSVGLSGDTLLDNLRRSADKDLSSKTLRAIQNAQEDTRSVVAKMQEELATFGAYAASKAMADSKLLVSVGIVVASEFAQALARPLLPPAPSSSAAAASPPPSTTSSTSPSSPSPFSRLTKNVDLALGLNLTATVTAALSTPTTPTTPTFTTTSSSSLTGASPLTFAEKVELVGMGVYPYDWPGLASGGTSTYILPSFSSAGDPDALLLDMFNKGAAQDGRLLLPFLPPSLSPFLPRLPKQLVFPLSLPLKALAAIPSLPSSALRAIDSAHRMNQDAAIRQPSRRLLVSSLAVASSVAGPLLGKGTWEEQLQQQQQQRVQQRLLLDGAGKTKKRRKGGENKQQQQQQQHQQQQQGWWEGFNLRLLPEKEFPPSFLPPSSSSSSSSLLTDSFSSSLAEEEEEEDEEQGQGNGMRWPRVGPLDSRGGATTTAMRRSSSSSSRRRSRGIKSIRNSSMSGTTVLPVQGWGGEGGGEEGEGVLTIQVSRMGRAGMTATGGGRGRKGGRGGRMRGRNETALRAMATMAGIVRGEDEEKVGGREGGRGGRRAEIVWPGEGGEGRRRGIRSSFGDEDVIEAHVEEVGEDEGGREGGVGEELPALLLKVTLRVVDVALLGLEFVAVEGIPRVGRRVEVAMKRVKEGVRGRKGKKGWDLMPVFEKPMGVETMITKRR